MDLSISLNYFLNMRNGGKRSLAAAAGFISGAGFRYADYTPDFRSDDWEKKARSDREILDAAGITVEQTHAPFNRYRTHDEKMFPEYCMRLFKASKIVGAKYVVVHADEYRTVDRYDAREIEDFTYDYLAPYVEYAEKNRLIVAVENVFEDNNYRWPEIDGKSRFTSRIEELEGIIERFGTPTVACCWDFGHAKCAFGDGMVDAMKRVGRHIVCTHVHDNYYKKDLHLMPFEGEIDWEKNMACLRGAGYSGKLSFEFAYGSFPDGVLPSWLAAVHSVGEYLSALFDESGK